MSGPKIMPPSPEAIRRAAELAEELEDIATQTQFIRWTSVGAEKTGELMSQSDRLVVIAARLGRISELLRTQYIYPTSGENNPEPTTT